MFRILTDMQEIDEFWKAEMLYCRVAGCEPEDFWEEDRYDKEGLWPPSRYADGVFEHAIQVED